VDKEEVRRKKANVTIASFLLFTFCLPALVFLVLPAAVASAQQPTPSDDEVNAVAQQLYCPVCENTPLDVCPTQACQDWRGLIRQMLAEGKTPDEIKQYFVEHFGARVLPDPPLSGLNWLAYVVPPVIFLAGAFLLFRAFRTWKLQIKEQAARPDSAHRTEAGQESGLAADDEYAARLEEELRTRE
jgi:cytochrome c-type biogenesis protein CcmH